MKKVVSIMKKVVSIMLACFVAVTSAGVLRYPADASAAAAEPCIYEDFESSSLGKYRGSDFIDENGKVNVSTENGSNQAHIEFSSTEEAASGNVLSTRAINVSKELTISFDIRNAASSTGSITAQLRASSGSADEKKTIINIVTLTGGKINYLPQMLTGWRAKSENIADTAYASIEAIINPESGRIRVYNNGVLKAEVSNYKTLNSNSWGNNFTMDDCVFRFQTIAPATPSGQAAYTAKTYLDNIYIGFDNSCETGVAVSQSMLYYGEDVREAVHSLKNGPLTGRVMVANNSSKSINACLILAHKSAGVLKDISVGNVSTVRSRAKADLYTEFDVSGAKAGDVLEMYLFDTARGIAPLSYKTSYTAQAVADPIKNELEFLYSQNGQNIHPKVMASSSDFTRVLDDGTLESWKDSVIEAADSIGNAHIAGMTYSDNADTFLGRAQTVKKYMQNLGMAYQLTENTDYVNKAYRILKKAGEFSSWHHGISFLGTAEMTMAFAIGYDWMYDGFTSDQRAEIAGYIKTKGLDCGKAAYDGTGADVGNTGWWKDVDHNWNIVCNSGMIAGAVAVADLYPELCFDIVDRAIASMGKALANFAPDGAWFEGYDYAEFILQTLSVADSSLVQAFGTDFGITNYEGMNKIGDFMLHMTGAEYTNNFHDSSEIVPNTPELMWLSKVYDKPEYMMARVRALDKGAVSPSAFDLLFYNGELYNSGLFPENDAYFRGPEYVSMRSGWGDDDLWLSFHGGDVSVNHGHADSGTFVFDALGERWACDLGPDSYSADGYFGEKRYNYYRARAEGHNVIVIDPDTSAGQELNGKGTFTSRNLGVQNPSSVLDLTSAYSQKADSVTRTFSLADNRSAAVINDAITLRSASSTVYWFMHTKADITIEDSNSAVLELGGKKLRVDFETTAPTTELTEKNAEPMLNLGVTQNAGNSAYKKIQLKVSGSKEIKIKATLTPISQ